MGTESTGIAIDSANRISTSLNRSRRCYVGLHVDNWDNLPIPERPQSRNRSMVNLGRGDRWFLFAGRTLPEMAAALGCADGRPKEIVRRFFECFPDSPIFKLRTATGEAYIAPTDNLVHDGTTAGGIHSDAFFTDLGDFRP